MRLNKGFDSWVGKFPWRKKWQPTPVFLPGKSHGQRSPIGYSPGARKQLDTTEPLHFTSQVVTEHWAELAGAQSTFPLAIWFS